MLQLSKDETEMILCGLSEERIANHLDTKELKVKGTDCDLSLYNHLKNTAKLRGLMPKHDLEKNH